MAQIFNSSSYEAEVGGSLCIESQLGPHSAFQDNQGHTERSCLKNTMKNKIKFKKWTSRKKNDCWASQGWRQEAYRGRDVESSLDTLSGSPPQPHPFPSQRPLVANLRSTPQPLGPFSQRDGLPPTRFLPPTLRCLSLAELFVAVILRQPVSGNHSSEWRKGSPLWVQGNGLWTCMGQAGKRGCGFWWSKE